MALDRCKWKRSVAELALRKHAKQVKMCVHAKAACVMFRTEWVLNCACCSGDLDCWKACGKKEHVCDGDRERRRERERERERETERETDRQTDRQTERERERVCVCVREGERQRERERAR